MNLAVRCSGPPKHAIHTASPLSPPPGVRGGVRHMRTIVNSRLFRHVLVFDLSITCGFLSAVACVWALLFRRLASAMRCASSRIQLLYFLLVRRDGGWVDSAFRAICFWFEGKVVSRSRAKRFILSGARCPRLPFVYSFWTY